MESINRDFISLKEASKMIGCTPEHLNLMVRRKKLEAKKLGRNWYTTKEWILKYSENVKKVKEAKRKKLKLKYESTIGIKLGDKLKLENKDKKEAEIIKKSKKEFLGKEIVDLKKSMLKKVILAEVGKKSQSSDESEIEEKEKIPELAKKEIVFKKKNDRQDKLENENHSIKEKIKNISGIRIISRYATLGIAMIVILVAMPAFRYKFSNVDELEKFLAGINESIFFNDESGIVKGEETQILSDMESGVVLASENYKLRQIRFGGDVIVRSEDDIKLEIQNIRSETFLTKKQDESKAVITWSTNKGSICEINYSKNNGLDERKMKENGFGYNHGVVLTGLEMDQAYVYQITAKDRWGNTVDSGNFAIYSGKKAVSVVEMITKELEKMFGWAKVK